MENLSLPSNGSLIRLQPVDYEDKCDQFRVGRKSFQTQYFPYYNARAEQMTKMVEMRAKQQWGEDTKFQELNQINETEGQKVCLVGVIFKYLEKHPSILKEVSEDFQFKLLEEETKFTGENDFVMLQQGKDTIRLNGEIKVDELVNGVMIAVVGYNKDEINSFSVEDYCFAGPMACIERPIPVRDQFIVIVSGLGFSKKMPLNLTESLNSLSDYLIGFNDGNSSNESSQVVKLIIAGNCISKQVRIDQSKEEESVTSTQWAKKQKTTTADIMEMVDNWIFQIGKFIEVDIMPGELDPTSIIMPQQPLHVAVLPKSNTLNSIRCLTNPYAAKINGTYIMGSSGQTVDSIRAYSSFDEPLEILKQKLIWSHLAPTAPDALYSYPFTDKDPFVIDVCPHVLFASNQDHFNVQTYKNKDQDVRLLSIPSFEEKLTCVLINLKNLKCDYMAFN